ncbi:Multi antimicrobial extrusion protein [Corchorus olitorius]|uniref:Multi antimicrobial extrusion protein n=1 Tax=Corchorus olitorius TaxID=93759 RepID=A0A1R3IBW9_9ROSI|nr:Multi antimicrobial extrusion protein [Corchorus olitorius]
MALLLFAGYLKNPEVSVGALSICTVRVSNELGARHPRRTKFSMLVAVIFSFMIGATISLLILIISRNTYASLFSNDTQVQDIVKDLTPLLALSILINDIQPVLSGVAVGAGWQAAVAYVIM